MSKLMTQQLDLLDRAVRSVRQKQSNRKSAVARIEAWARRNAKYFRGKPSAVEALRSIRYEA